jgi:prepilin-type N-terminal cleavage/methylation domain-containing protein/prepilin-type processing-associated H-X9-DG protein
MRRADTKQTAWDARGKNRARALPDRGSNRAARPEPRAFSLVELLVVMAVIGVLAALLMPVLGKAKATAKRADCVSNLRQLGVATQLYWDDNGGNCFSYYFGATNSGQILWFGWLGAGAEGHRPFDLSLGALAPYLSGSDVRLCPVLDPGLAHFKPKGTNVIFSYGCNSYLFGGPGQTAVNAKKISRPADTALFADAVQVNDFQPPASHSNPMLEEWYYVDSNAVYPNGHFRHAQRANAVFCDGHVALEKFVPGSLDQRLPGQFVGRLRPEILVIP